MIDLLPYLKQLSEVADTLLAPEVLLSAGVLTALAGFVGRVAWSGATVALGWLHGWHLRTVQCHTVALARKQLPTENWVLLAVR